MPRLDPKLPVPPGGMLLGNLREFWSDRAGTMLRGMERHGDHVGYRLGPVAYLVLTDPASIRHVLVSRSEGYVKSFNYRALELGFGKGLVTSDGALWKRQRRVAAPSFRPPSVAALAVDIDRCANDMLGTWAERARTGEAFDLHRQMLGVALRIAGHTLLGVELQERPHFAHALNEVIEFANRWFQTLVRLPAWAPLPSYAHFRRHLRVVDAEVFELIASQRGRGGAEPGHNLLRTLLQAIAADPEHVTVRQVRDEIMTMLIAGHDTTANALTWTFDLLARHPDVLARVEREVDEVVGAGNLDAATASRLTYTDQVVREALRLYPPVWNYERQAIGWERIGDYDVAPGTVVAICAYALHRSAKFWPDPETFDPERFSPEQVAARPRYAYLPFGAGPRVCIGAELGLMEAKIVIARVVQRFRLQLQDPAPIGVLPSITLQPSSPVMMQAQPRAPHLRGVSVGAPR